MFIACELDEREARTINRHTYKRALFQLFQLLANVMPNNFDSFITNNYGSLAVTEPHEYVDVTSNQYPTASNNSSNSRASTGNGSTSKEGPKKLGTFSLAVLAFYCVSGGPFGVESIVRAGCFDIPLMFIIFSCLSK